MFLQFLSRLRDRLPLAVWEFLMTAAQLAEHHHWHLYIVGGTIRDLWLEKLNGYAIKPIVDIDLVVDSTNEKSAVPNSGIELAKALLPLYPTARLVIHETFQTADLVWHDDPQFHLFSVDFATARTETYAYPAANPEVKASSIFQDLYRRDFTTNALAVRLTHPHPGELLDFFEGLNDLNQRKLRVLHDRSFIDDPTRIYRGARLAVQLGFDLEARTKVLIREALSSGIYVQARAEHGKVPALQTRLKAELKYAFEATHWKPILKKLAELGALECIHPKLTIDDRLWWKIRFVDRALRRFAGDSASTTFADRAIVRWLMLLEVMLASLPEKIAREVAIELHLIPEIQIRLGTHETREKLLGQRLLESKHPSDILRAIERYDLPSLILIMANSPKSIRRKIWHYLTYLQHVRAPIDGRDLQTMGYKPSSKFRQILEELLEQTLDGKIQTRQQAELFIQENYPL
jgi:tRNA nucleotidyltransferase (CCA-adding enzyme)